MYGVVGRFRTYKDYAYSYAPSPAFFSESGRSANSTHDHNYIIAHYLNVKYLAKTFFMKIHQIKDLSNHFVVKLLESGLSKITDERLIKNYHPDFRQHNSNLFFLLDTGRYETGNYFVIEDNGQYVGSSGWNWYEDDIALLLTRCYMDKAYRFNYLMAEHFMPRMFEETNQYNRLWITVNGYNKIIYDGLTKMYEGKRVGLFKPWPEIYGKFKPIGIRTVNYTEQYVVEYTRNKNEQTRKD